MIIKIIGGDLKGRTISVQKSRELRPTGALAREALFNILREKVVSSRFLDLFSGTGGIGIEALSRKASEVRLVDKDFRKKEIERLKEFEKYSEGNLFIEKVEVEKFLKSASKLFASSYDIVFADPPWDQDLLDSESLGYIYEILSSDGLFIIESYKKNRLYDFAKDGIKMVDERVYGETRFNFYLKNF